MYSIPLISTQIKTESRAFARILEKKSWEDVVLKLDNRGVWPKRSVYVCVCECVGGGGVHKKKKNKNKKIVNIF